MCIGERYKVLKEIRMSNEEEERIYKPGEILTVTRRGQFANFSELQADKDDLPLIVKEGWDEWDTIEHKWMSIVN